MTNDTLIKAVIMLMCSVTAAHAFEPFNVNQKPEEIPDFDHLLGQNYHLIVLGNLFSRPLIVIRRLLVSIRIRGHTTCSDRALRLSNA